MDFCIDNTWYVAVDHTTSIFKHTLGRWLKGEELYFNQILPTLRALAAQRKIDVHSQCIRDIAIELAQHLTGSDKETVNVMLDKVDDDVPLAPELLLELATILDDGHGVHKQTIASHKLVKKKKLGGKKQCAT